MKRLELDLSIKFWSEKVENPVLWNQSNLEKSAKKMTDFQNRFFDLCQNLSDCHIINGCRDICKKKLPQIAENLVFHTFSDQNIGVRRGN